MEKLDVYSLSLIFKELNLVDLANCSKVCQYWKQVIQSKKLKNLFICYGAKFIPPKKHCHHQSITPDKKCSLIPNYGTYNTFLSFNEAFKFKYVETFIYYGNHNFKIMFPFYNKPNLKYVEIRDSKFSNCIDENYEEFLRKKINDVNETCVYFSSSLETLIINEIDLVMLIYGFPNLQHVQIKKFLCRSNIYENLHNIKATKWKSFTMENDEYFFDYNNKNLIFEFLSKKCPDLEAVSFSITNVEQFKSLLNIPKLKHICIKLYWDDYSINNPHEYQYLISKHEYRIKNECNLCINSFPVKSLNDFYRLIDNRKLNFEFNFENLNLNIEKNFLTITGPYNFDKIKNNPYLTNIKRVFVYDKFESNLQIDVLFSQLPKTIKALKIFSKNSIYQDILELIPEKFPYLNQLHIGSPFIEIKSCSFFSQMKFLNRLTLKTLKVNSYSFINELKELDFLNYLEIDLKYEMSFKSMILLNNDLRLKNIYGSYSLILNGLPISLSKKDLDELKAMKLFEELFLEIFI